MSTSTADHLLDPEFQNRFRSAAHCQFSVQFGRLLQDGRWVASGIDPLRIDGPELEISRLRRDTVRGTQRSIEWPAMPSIVARLDKVLNSPKSSAADIAEVVQLDPGLTIQVLELVNSPAFGLTRKIASLEQAVALLGVVQIRMAALSVSVIRTFSDSVAGLDVKGFWEHSLAVGLCAERLGRVLHDASNDRDAAPRGQLFLAGLLHDIGRVVIAQQLPEKYAAIDKAVQRHGSTWLEAELSILGLQHTQIGHDMLKGWSMETAICEAALFHHDAFAAPEFARIVYCADAIAHGLGYSPRGFPFRGTDPRIWESMSLSNEAVRSLAVALLQDMELLRNSLLN